MKQIFICLVLLMLSVSSYAQDQSSPYYGFRLGLTAHPTIGWVKPQIGKSNSVSMGFSYGLLADFNFTQNYSFATGLTITTINGRTKEARTVSNEPPAQTEVQLKYKLQYIEIPLTLKLKTVKIDDVRWYGQFGLSNDFKIRGRQDVNVKADSEYASENIKFYRSGLIIGAGAEFDVKANMSIATGLTFNNGFTNITGDKDNRIRNHYIGINFGVFF